MSKRKVVPIDPEDVLSGRVKPSAADLLLLIHRENPTGLDLGARETALRYARKARLQSLLVRRFADELEIALDPAQPDTVSLRHRGHGRDACHAVLAALDEDARSWAQRELDLASPAAPDTAVPAARPSGRGAQPSRRDDAEDETPEGLLRRAEAAIDSYDYEGARGMLEQALEASRGAAGPAAALLALLVETLGDDAGALAIEARIAKAALAEARVRAPLALAAARSGDEERALGMTRGLDDARAAAVFAALASSALTAGDVERAAAHVEQARRRDPACPGIAGAAGEVAAARAKASAPAEAEIAALLAAGRDAEAERRAGEVLARWPSSAAARRALRDIEERRRKAAVARLVTEADEAAARGDAASALARLGQAAAAALGAEREAIDERAQRLLAAERERRDAERVALAIRLLEAADPEEGLTVYAELEEALRARVRARSTRPELSLLDRMAGGRGGDRAKVEAALALAEARATLERDPEAAIALLAPHEAWLERVPEARRIGREVDAALRAGRLVRARAAIDAARAELAAGAADEALARLGAASLRELPDEERAGAAAVEAAATRVVQRRRRAEEAASLRAAGRLFEARALAEALARGAEDANDRTRWERERDAIRAEIRRSFRVEVDDEPRSAEELGRFRPHAAIEEAPWWLTADGRGIVIARAYERWVVVYVLDRETTLVHPTVLLRTPEPLGKVDVRVCGPTLWLTGGRGAIVEIEMAGWEVRDFRPSADVATPAEIVETAVVVATEDPSAPRYFWVGCRTPGRDSPDRVRVIDLAQRRVVREMPSVWRATPIAGLDEPRVTTMTDLAAILHTPRGAVVPHGRIELQLAPLGLAAHPSGEGFVALMSERVSDDYAAFAARRLHVATISPTGVVNAVAKLEDSDPDRPSCVAAARGSGLVHAISTGNEASSLVALTSGEDRGLVPLYSLAIGGDTMLVQDAGARRIVALTVHDHGVDATALGATPPSHPVRAQRPPFDIPGRESVLICGRPSGERNAAARALAATWRDLSDGETLRRVHELEHAETTTPERLVEVVYALRAQATITRMREADRVIRRTFTRFPAHPEVRLLRAHEPTVAGRWAEARETLVGVEPRDLDTSRAQHLHHLRALAALGEARLAEAEQEVTAALALEGHCSVHLAPVASLIASVSRTTSPAGAELSALEEIIAAIRAADARFAAHDPAGARATLDQPIVWWARETQSLARLAEAYVATEPGSRAERLRKLATLGTLLNHLADSRTAVMRALPLPGAWDAARIAGVADRAREWLDGLGGPGEG